MVKSLQAPGKERISFGVEAERARGHPVDAPAEPTQTAERDPGCESAQRIVEPGSERGNSGDKSS